MFFKSPQPRQFEYRPRFFRPEPEEDTSPRIKFRRLLNRRQPPKRRSMLGMVILIIMLIFLLYYVLDWGKPQSKQQPMEDLKIKVIE